MSAYICNPELFVRLATFACPHADCERAETLANMLYDANIASVQYRYPRDKPDELPGPIDRPERISVTPCDYLEPQRSIVALLKDCACLEYQSCELPDWRSTNACWAIHNIRHELISRLPGYADAPWGD